MKSKGLVVSVPGCGGLEAPDIGAVSQLGLSVTADDLVGLGLFEEQLVLLRRALFTQGHQEHAGMEAVRCGLADEIIGGLELVFGPVVLDLKLLKPLASCQSSLDSRGLAPEVIL